ncbi:hypothetical protein H5T51_00795 [Candidatus Bathyarchaeota archaeon]|nr:hypothetical protein [Candidatus Bathyarchaeota archaeon]
MLRQIEEFRKFVAIAGFRDVKINNVEAFIKKVGSQVNSDIAFQFFDARFVATWQHLYFAALKALKAFSNSENISRNLAIEILLYASAQRQIRKAMEILGIKSNSSEIALLVVGKTAEQAEAALSMIAKSIPGKRDDSVLSLSEDKKKALMEVFEISDVELETMCRGNEEETIVDLIIERMALLAVQR